MKTIGLDLGEKRIGVAVSDDEGRVAIPAGTLAGDKPQAEVIADILELAQQYAAERIIVGMPTSLSGQAGPAAQKVSDFVEALGERSAVEIAVWDERLTTAQAEKAMLADGVSHQRRRSNIDKIAAALILQSYLDAHADDEAD